MEPHIFQPVVVSLYWLHYAGWMRRLVCIICIFMERHRWRYRCQKQLINSNRIKIFGAEWAGVTIMLQISIWEMGHSNLIIRGFSHSLKLNEKKLSLYKLQSPPSKSSPVQYLWWYLYFIKYYITSTVQRALLNMPIMNWFHRTHAFLLSHLLSQEHQSQSLSLGQGPEWGWPKLGHHCRLLMS